MQKILLVFVVKLSNKQMAQQTKVLDLSKLGEKCALTLQSQTKSKLYSYNIGAFHVPFYDYPLLCGGHFPGCQRNCYEIPVGNHMYFKFSKDSSSKCHIPNTDAYFETLKSGRSFAATLIIAEKSILVVGGKMNKFETHTSEIISAQESTSNGPELPFTVGNT